MKIIIAPADVYEEVDQNVRTIIGVIIGECFLDRELGLTGDVQDFSTLAAAERYEAEIIEKIEMREPRARVTSVEFLNNGEPGGFYPKVSYEVINESA